MDKRNLLTFAIEKIKEEQLKLERTIEELQKHKKDAPTAMESNSDRTRYELEAQQNSFRVMIEDYTHAITQLKSLEINEHDQNVIQLGSLITLQNKEQILKTYFLVPQSKGIRFEYEGRLIILCSPDTPLGGMLTGKKKGDVIEINNNSFTVVAFE